MFSPSEIQRVEDWVGIATPIRPPSLVVVPVSEPEVLVEVLVVPPAAHPARTSAEAEATATRPSSFLNNLFLSCSGGPPNDCFQSCPSQLELNPQLLALGANNERNYLAKAE